MVWPTADIPTYGRGVWLECNGQSFSRTQFPQLYETLGKTTVPDFRGRFLVSAGGSYSVGNTGGSDSVTLSVNQMPSHSHSVSYITAVPAIMNDSVGDTDNELSHELYGSVLQDWMILETGGKDPEEVSDEYAIRFSGSGEKSNLIIINYATNSGSSGRGNSHENRPPYIAVKWMIKAK